MHRSSRIALLLGLSLGLFATLLAVPAHAVVPATLVDSKLGTEAIQLAGLRDGVLVYFDHERRLREASLRDYVQIRAIGETPTSSRSAAATPAPSADSDTASVARVTLVDGQVLPGQWVRGRSDGEGFVWQHARFGEVEIPLEDLAGLTLTGEPIIEPGATEDVVRLSNGDQLRGFASGVEEQGLSLVPAGADAPIVLPMERIAAVRLANPVQPVSDADRVTLADGTVLLAQRIVIAGDEASFNAALPGRAMRTVTLPLSHVARIELTTGGVELVDLGALPRQMTSGGDVLGLTMAPRLEGATVALHAPLTLRIELPPGATRFAAEATLPSGPDVSDRLLEYADFELVLRLESGQTLDRLRFNAEHPRHTINLALPSESNPSGKGLLLELDAGSSGPVFDRLELHHPTLLIAPVAVPSDSSEAAGW